MSSGPAFIDPLDHTDTELGAMVRDAHASGVRVVMLLKLPTESESEWTGIRRDPAIRAWSTNPDADEAFARVATEAGEPCAVCGRDRDPGLGCEACADEAGARPDPDDLPM